MKNKILCFGLVLIFLASICGCNAEKACDNIQKHLPEEHKAGKVLFVITTDGLENSSKGFSCNDILRLIEAKKECGWEFFS